jgi:hypothetical protein
MGEMDPSHLSAAFQLPSNKATASAGGPAPFFWPKNGPSGCWPLQASPLLCIHSGVTRLCLVYTPSGELYPGAIIHIITLLS